MFITGTYNLVARPEWKNIQTEIVYLECDTSLAPVTINLFPIVDLKRFWNVKINIVDKAQNCSVNNITINAGFSGTPPVQDIIDQSGHTQIVLSKNGESILITPVSENQWLANESITVPYAVQSVTGLNTDNTDPINPVVKISVDSATVTGLGTPLSPLESNLVVGTTQIISGTSGAVLFDNGTTVAESTNFVYDDGLIVLSLGGSTSSAKGMLNIKAKDTLATTYSIAVRKNDDSGYLFQVQNDGKLRINDNYTLPNSDGTAGQVLVTDGSGTVTFQSKQDPITLTTTGNSGASTLIGATLNIPEYTLAGLGGVPLGRSININGTTQDLSANRTFTVSDANLSMSDITTNNVSITQHGFAPKAPNDVTKYLDGTGNWSVPSSYGVCGIADNTGKYTYYASLTLAMASAVAGQTIEVFADVTETGAVTVNLKDGVTINGNGHTYNHTQAGASDVFETTVAGTYRIYNLNVIRTNATGGNILNAKNNVASIHYLDGCSFITNRNGINATAIGSTIQQFYNGNITINSNGSGFLGSSTSTQLFNFRIVGLSTATGNCINGGVMYDSTFEHFGSGVVTCRTFNAYNCSIISNTDGRAASDFFAYNCFLIGKGSGTVASLGYNLSNCTIYSTAGMCVTQLNGTINNCTIYSTANYAVNGNGVDLYRNCSIISTANVAAYGSTKLYNCSLRSDAAIVIYNNSGLVDNCSIECTWNNLGGHGFRTDVTTVPVKNSSIKVTNASANCLYSASAITVKYASNVFEGSTTPVNANITQGITNTQDNQGNILI